MINLILHLMENETLKTAFLKLANMSISASWLALAVLLLRLVLKKAPKWVNVLLWGIVAVRLICPFTIESALSLIPSTQTIPMNIEMAAKPAIDSGVPVVNSVVNPMIAASFTPNPAASANPLQIWIPLAAVIWTFGMLLMLLYTAVSYWRLNRRIDTAVLYRDNIFQSENVSSPFVLGIIKPRIYLPFHMNEKDLRHVVAHEQAHIRRKDHWWKPLGFLLLTIHWFNPLMWLAYVLLCRDIELACDEKVIKELNSEQRADYTQALVDCSVNRRMIAACPLAFGEVGVKDRVKSIMNYRKPTFWITMTGLVACVIASICFLTNPISHESNKSFLNYRNAISLSDHQDVIPAVHYSSQNEQGLIGIGMVEGDAFARFLGSVGWTEKWMEPSDLSSPGSVAVNVADNLRITVYDRNFAAVEFNDEVCYYRINNSDYEKILELLMPADEERLEKSSDTRLDIVLGIATIEKNPDSISLGVIISEKEHDDITEFKLQNLHNGSWSFITDEKEVNSVLQFLSKVEGINKISSKGYYGGCYAIQAQNGNEIVFSIGFGDDESFNYGDYGDGYPARYELDGITKEEIIRFFSQYDSSDFDWGLDNENRLSDHPLVAYISSEWAVDSKADNIELPFKKLMINDDGSGVIDGTEVTWKICDEFTSNQSIHIEVYTDSELIVSVVYWSKSQLLQIVDESGNLLECYYHRIAYPTA